MLGLGTRLDIGFVLCLIYIGADLPPKVHEQNKKHKLRNDLLNYLEEKRSCVVVS